MERAAVCSAPNRRQPITPEFPGQSPACVIIHSCFKPRLSGRAALLRKTLAQRAHAIHLQRAAAAATAPPWRQRRRLLLRSGSSPAPGGKDGAPNERSFHRLNSARIPLASREAPRPNAAFPDDRPSSFGGATAPNAGTNPFSPADPPSSESQS